MCITAPAAFETGLSAVSILHDFPQKRNCFGKYFSLIRTKRRTLRGQRRETEQFSVKRIGFTKICYSCFRSVHRYQRSRLGSAKTRAVIRIEQTDLPPPLRLQRDIDCVKSTQTVRFLRGKPVFSALLWSNETGMVYAQTYGTEHTEGGIL